MDYHMLWLLERSTKDNRSMEIEAERMRQAVNREWYIPKLLEWIRIKLLEMQPASASPAKLASREHERLALITSCPMVISPIPGEKKQC